MILSLTHHAAHAHHLGRAVAAITLAAASTVGLVQTHSADPVARVSVSRTVEAPAPEPAATPSTFFAASTILSSGFQSGGPQKKSLALRK